LPLNPANCSPASKNPIHRFSAGRKKRKNCGRRGRLRELFLQKITMQFSLFFLVFRSSSASSYI
jgi:hypothetical protein